MQCFNSISEPSSEMILKSLTMLGCLPDSFGIHSKDVNVENANSFSFQNALENVVKVDKYGRDSS